MIRQCMYSITLRVHKELLRFWINLEDYGQFSLLYYWGLNRIESESVSFLYSLKYKYGTN